MQQLHFSGWWKLMVISRIAKHLQGPLSASFHSCWERDPSLVAFLVVPNPHPNDGLLLGSFPSHLNHGPRVYSLRQICNLPHWGLIKFDMTWLER